MLMYDDTLGTNKEETYTYSTIQWIFQKALKNAHKYVKVGHSIFPVIC